MAYESRLYFAYKGNLKACFKEEEHHFAIKLIEINMSKLGGMPECFKRPTDYFIYADDGNTPILRDRYGEPLYECTLSDLWQWLCTWVKKEDAVNYHPVQLLVNILKGFGHTDFTGAFKIKPEFKDVIVLHYGY